MPYTNFTEKLLGLQDLIITNVIEECRFTIDMLHKER